MLKEPQTQSKSHTPSFYKQFETSNNKNQNHILLPFINNLKPQKTNLNIILPVIVVDVTVTHIEYLLANFDTYPIHFRALTLAQDL